MKLPVLKPKQILKILQRAGFTIDHQKGSHVSLFNQSTNKHVTLPYHSHDLKKGTMHSIIKQAGLTLNEFIRLM